MVGRSGRTSTHALKRRIKRISGVEPTNRPRHPGRVQTRPRVFLDLDGATPWRQSLSRPFAERLGHHSQLSRRLVHGDGNGAASIRPWQELQSLMTPLSSPFQIGSSVSALPLIAASLGSFCANRSVGNSSFRAAKSSERTSGGPRHGEGASLRTVDIDVNLHFGVEDMRGAAESMSRPDCSEVPEAPEFSPRSNDQESIKILTY
jgi:hypothetical protein